MIHTGSDHKSVVAHFRLAAKRPTHQMEKRGNFLVKALDAQRADTAESQESSDKLPTIEGRYIELAAKLPSDASATEECTLRRSRKI